jgi:hypothetical protein
MNTHGRYRVHALVHDKAGNYIYESVVVYIDSVITNVGTLNGVVNEWLNESFDIVIDGGNDIESGSVTYSFKVFKKVNNEFVAQSNEYIEYVGFLG